MNTAKTRAMIIGGALLLIVAVGAFWMLPKNQADQNVPDAASDLWNQPADTAVTPDPNKTDTTTPAAETDETSTDLVAGMTDYVVGPDDSLSSIAQKIYGDSSMYWLIEWYNEETLAGNINKLVAGTHLNIPDKSKANQPKPSTQPQTGTEKTNTQPQTGTEKPNTQTPTQNTNPSTTPGR